MFSCSNWAWGHFNAYAAAAQLDLDFWMHVGDYFYEYGAEHYPSQAEAVRAGPHPLDPSHELLTLPDYRRRHRFYRLDPDLQALSASAALIAVWDDHEIANNPWVHGAENHQPDEVWVGAL